MQIIRKVGLIQGLNLHLKEQILVLMSPLVRDLQQDLQRLHPSMQVSEYIYHQMQDRKSVCILLTRSCFQNYINEHNWFYSLYLI